jgi:two-component system LytT family response regulator
MKRDGRRIRVIIADSDPMVRDCVRAALDTETDMHVIAECVSGADTVRAVQAYRPELLLLGVQMSNGGGVEVIEQIGPDRMPATIFMTLRDEDMIRGLDAHALDYLVTPFSDDAVRAALAKVRARQDGAPERTGEKLADFLANREAPSAPGNGNGEPPSLARFMIRERDRIRFIPADEVDWIEGARNYVRLHVGERSHLLRGPLTAILAQLDPDMFARIHRSIIVNTERIAEIQPWVGGDYVAILRSGQRLRVSRNFRHAVVRTTQKA